MGLGKVNNHFWISLAHLKAPIIVKTEALSNFRLVLAYRSKADARQSQRQVNALKVLGPRGLISHQSPYVPASEMRVARLFFGLFAEQAFFAFAASVKPFVIQDQEHTGVGTGFCNGRGPPKAQLDNGTFTGTCIARTARFLGIPFAQPP